ncbi:Na-translocating system protein MpsC family protein [Nitrospira sp. NS4]|uniref:Na-translocating system protein MpsC family protein n=1 Tax=Nitrospira sp. NS4 TaxID=3414498 RepID=UPI003C2AF99C
MIPSAPQSRADMEYQVMLTVLNFHRDYLHLHYSRAKIHLSDNVIEVTLAPRNPIPAEQLLARSSEGRVELQQMHAAAFHSGQTLLGNELQRILGVVVDSFATRLDAESGINTVSIRLAKGLDIVLPPASSSELESEHLA